MHCETKKFIEPTLLEYSLYCCTLELNLHYSLRYASTTSLAQVTPQN